MIDWWRSRRPAVRATIFVGAAVIGLLVIANVLGDALERRPGGPRSSSFATGPDGLKAYAELLRIDGRQVTHRRPAIREGGLPRGSTLVIAEPEVVLPDDLTQAQRFVRDGGRVVLLGRSATPYVRRLIDARLGWAPTDGGRWSDGAQERLVVGTGPVVALADPGRLQNAHLGQNDNAALGLRLAGPSGAVLFAEHDRLVGGGGSALPRRWSDALYAALGAVLVYLWWASARLGPPERAGRPMAPPRRAYVDALAAALARAHGSPELVLPVQERARSRLAHRLGLGADVDAQTLANACMRASIDLPDVDALFLRPATRTDVLRIGRTAAHLEGVL